MPDASCAELLTGEELKRFVVLVFIALLLTPVCSAFAEPAKLDRDIAQGLLKDPATGIVFMEVRFLEEGTKPPNCQEIVVDLVSETGKTTFFSTQQSPSVLGNTLEGATYGDAARLPAGTYTIVEAACRGQIKLRGQFSKFRLQAGEVINAGALIIDFKRPPALHLFPIDPTTGTRVADLAPRAIESLRTRAPVAFSKAVKRYMVLTATMNR